MTSNSLVSVIVPIYNSENQIGSCIDSIINQTYKNLEIILVDDGSTDQSPEIIDRYAAMDSRITVVHRQNGGISAARNTGISKAGGKWIYFVDSDDTIQDNAVETLLSHAIDKDGSICMCGYYKKSGKKQTQIHVTEQILQDKEAIIQYSLSEGRNHNHSWQKLFSRDIFTNASYNVGRYYEDIFILPHLLSRLNVLVIIDIPLYNYIIHDNSITFDHKISTHMDGLDAYLEIIKYIEADHPEHLGLAHSCIIEYCSFLLGKISQFGRKKHPEAWNTTVNTFNIYRKTASRNNMFIKLSIAIFRISPALLGWMCKKYSSIKNHI